MGTAVSVLLIVAILGGGLWFMQSDTRQRMIAAHKERDEQIVCPHCQTRGQVRTSQTRQKRGISGGKAVGAVATLGVSMLATGLSRKQWYTKMKCGNCGTQWLV